MILIADGGSTKADWICLDKSGNQVFKTRTNGLNPEILNAEAVLNRIQENQEITRIKNEVAEVYFYGAGCGTDRMTSLLTSIFESFFINAKIVVKEDTFAAVYAVTTQPGIVCILGTGSNSCYFDGENVEVRVPSLGYILMDEASGNHFGKILIQDYYYGKMPKKAAKLFEKQFDLDADTIKKNIYKEENPNAYLATFAEFLLKNERTAYFNKVLRKGIVEFFKNRVLTYKECEEVPVHFVGSIAFFGKDIIEDVANYYRIVLGKVVRRPIDGLIDYHREKLKLEKV
ncbi:BadF/BadG/BcrA/BcrD ATPase family protein [Lutibacter oceani]|uniref:BadF/BadG/BcrA/BcrD ATPase family protein n=1 Tax=Lutibacter oceani TaxID=1853311 RepID=A0A3D9RJV7_9FLAO|nr:BadF/BadG/BcrA/BcrD ATPase family protein [Lutibacter oceani]REE80017.1 BadF/BadG/BcrA/BcrD ATPase family protein [Lutibacter oceani]